MIATAHDSMQYLFTTNITPGVRGRMLPSNDSQPVKLFRYLYPASEHIYQGAGRRSRPDLVFDLAISSSEYRSVNGPEK